MAPYDAAVGETYRDLLAEVSDGFKTVIAEGQKTAAIRSTLPPETTANALVLMVEREGLGRHLPSRHEAMVEVLAGIAASGPTSADQRARAREHWQQQFSAEHQLQRWAALLGGIGRVELFDYPYLAEGRKRPDPLPKLIEAHRAALERARERADGPVVLIGKSMGSRVGCHLSLEKSVSALVCLGYPLCGGGDRAKLRDKVLCELQTPLLFVQGTRDSLCPLDLLADVRARMTAPNELLVVEGGNHSLEVSAGQREASGITQADSDARVLAAIGEFVAGVAKG
jgi:predicted alpha/beta-hydrolase family hydrolase